jgi:putative peptide zinc metalloprotease protein
VAGLRPLTLLTEGDDEVVVTSVDTGTSIAIPAVGAVVIRALRRGATVGETAAEAAVAAGEPVDVAAFVEALTELGMVDDGSTATISRTAPIQLRHWVGGPLPAVLRPLFTRTAGIVYAAAYVAVIVLMIARPQLRPHPGAIFVWSNYPLSLLVLTAIELVLTGIHEVWHWLAARSLGLTARFGVDRRLFFFVFETDLSQLWTVPRRRRYGPQLAGLAVDGVLLLGVLGVASLGDVAGRIGAGLVFLMTAQIVWQSLVFLRTDLYGVLLTATGCRNLWEVKSLLLRRAFGRLDAAGAVELAAADPRDVRVGGWFRWVYLGGLVSMLGYFGYFFVPVYVRSWQWTAAGLAAGAADGQFWIALVSAGLVFGPTLVVAGITAVQLAAKLRRRTQTAQAAQAAQTAQTAQNLAGSV